jgi:hypothetical protein
MHGRDNQKSTNELLIPGLNRHAMKNKKGQEIRWVLEEDFLAHAKQTMPPEKYAEIEARHKRLREENEQLRERYKAKVPFGVTVTSRAVIPIEMITDPRTGQPKVFTEEERAKFELGNRGWSPDRREQVASYECNICHRLLGEHSWQEFDDCTAQNEAPTVRFGKGKRAKKEKIAHTKCDICSRTFGDHSQQEYDACMTQSMKRNLHRKQHGFRYVKCEICGDRFGDHSPEKYEACVDQIIDKGTFTDV